MDPLTAIDVVLSEEQMHELAEVRRALLLAEREEGRLRGQRKLTRIAEAGNPFVSPIAQSGLAASYYWSGDFNAAIQWARQTVNRYPMTAAAVWCSTLIVLVYRALGMRRERFEAEGERFRLMRQIAFSSVDLPDRVYALQELMRELEARDLAADAERCAEELRDLMLLSRRPRSRRRAGSVARSPITD